jgi:hypothetical protein
MTIPNFNLTEESKIKELLEKAPGNYFGLASSGVTIIAANFFKDRSEFWSKAKTYLTSDLAGPGIYNILGGSTKKTRTIFTIQKGSVEPGQKIEFMMPTEKTDIQLVKENAELKAELAYLKLRLEELTAQLEENEADLAEGEELKEELKPNPWASLAEQLIPVAGQIAAAIATKYLTPQNNGQGTTEQGTMEARHFGTNAQPATPPVQYRYPNNSGNLQGHDNSGTDVRNYYSQPNQEKQ